MSKVVHEVPAAHLVAAMLQSDNILMQLQRELYRALPGISFEQLRALLKNDILRTEVTSGEDAEEAQALLDRLAQLRNKGFTHTQALQAVTGESKADSEEELFRILREDKWSAASGG